jgi:hypothetical protein
VVAIQAMFGGDINNGVYDIGLCIQLLDDMMDVYEMAMAKAISIVMMEYTPLPHTISNISGY